MKGDTFSLRRAGLLLAELGPANLQGRREPASAGLDAGLERRESHGRARPCKPARASRACVESLQAQLFSRSSLHQARATGASWREEKAELGPVNVAASRACLEGGRWQASRRAGRPALIRAARDPACFCGPTAPSPPRRLRLHPAEGLPSVPCGCRLKAGRYSSEAHRLESLACVFSVVNR